MNCTSCNDPVPELDVVFFLSTFLCKECGRSANEFRDKAASELQAALAYLNTAIQQGLRDPSVKLKGPLPADLPKFGAAQLAANLCVRMQEAPCQQETQQEPTPSTMTTSPPVHGSDAQGPRSLPRPSAAD